MKSDEADLFLRDRAAPALPTSERALPTGASALPRSERPLPTGAWLLPGSEKPLPTGASVLPGSERPLPTGASLLPGSERPLPTGASLLPGSEGPLPGVSGPQATKRSTSTCTRRREIAVEGRSASSPSSARRKTSASSFVPTMDCTSFRVSPGPRLPSGAHGASWKAGARGLRASPPRKAGSPVRRPHAKRALDLGSPHPSAGL